MKMFQNLMRSKYNRLLSRTRPWHSRRLDVSWYTIRRRCICGHLWWISSSYSTNSSYTKETRMSQHSFFVNSRQWKKTKHKRIFLSFPIRQNTSVKQIEAFQLPRRRMMRHLQSIDRNVLRRHRWQISQLISRHPVTFPVHISFAYTVMRFSINKRARHFRTEFSLSVWLFLVFRASFSDTHAGGAFEISLQK